MNRLKMTDEIIRKSRIIGKYRDLVKFCDFGSLKLLSMIVLS
jgi:hypothetical protein